MFRNKFLSLRLSFRKWMRNRSRPLTLAEAEENKAFWVRMYLLCSFLAFGLTTVAIVTSSDEKNISKTLPVHEKLINKLKDDEQIRVIKFSGLKKTADVLVSKHELLEKGDVDDLPENTSQA